MMETNEMLPFALGDAPKDNTKNIIKVIGVGGGGSNAVKNMYKQGIYNVRFAICNTDSQALARADIPVKIQLGKAGLGVGGNPEKGKAAAEVDMEAIKSLFEDETEMVFITCGMGGGTGTGASPVIAKVAKEKGILTVGVVTIPFVFEGKKRIEKALLGVEEMRRNVDALLVINNERLCEMYADGSTTAKQAFAKADEILTVAAKSISETITVEGIVNRDFCDVQTVMKDGGNAIMSVGRANGKNRILKAFEDALQSPLLSNVKIEKARKMLYIIYSSEEYEITMSELKDIGSFMDDLSEDIEVLWGLYQDNTLGEDVKITLIASSFEDEMSLPVSSEPDSSKMNGMIQAYYGNIHGNQTEKEKSVEVETQISEEPIVESVNQEKEETLSSAQEEKKSSLLSRLMRSFGEVMENLD